MRQEGAVEPGTRVLIVDDDGELCKLVAEYLQTRGFAVDVEGDGERGLARARQGGYGLVVLDVMLPGLDGFEVLRLLRASGGEAADLPIVMLTAHGDEMDRVVGLELGADDYLAKPFSSRELVARIRAILRRSSRDRERGKEEERQGGEEIAGARIPASSPMPASHSLPDAAFLLSLHVGDVEMDLGARTVRRGSETLDLTAAEFDLLHVLLRAAGRVVSRDVLAREALGRKLLPLDRSLDIHISKLRHKLGPGGRGERIKTVRTVGYIYVKDER